MAALPNIEDFMLTPQERIKRRREAALYDGGMINIPNSILDQALQLASDPIYGGRNVAEQNYNVLADQFTGLPSTPEPKKRGFLGKLASALPEITAGLEYIAKSTSPSTRSQREAGDVLSGRLARISQLRDSRRMREQDKLDRERTKIADALNIAGKKLAIEDKKAQDAYQKEQDQLASVRQDNIDALNTRSINADIAYKTAQTNRVNQEAKQGTVAWNAQRHLYDKADGIIARHAKNPEVPYDPVELAVVKKAYPDFVSPDEQLQNFMADIADQVDAEIKLVSQGEEFKMLPPEEALQRISKLKRDRIAEKLAQLGMSAPAPTNGQNIDTNQSLLDNTGQGMIDIGAIQQLLNADPRLRGIGQNKTTMQQSQLATPDQLNVILQRGF